MEPALDEASLVPCPRTPPAQRICALAATLRALDQLGVPRVLRSVRGAADRDLQDGLGLRHWCFHRQTPCDEGRLVARRLDKAPFIDGSDGLFAVAERGRAVQPSIGGVVSLAGGHVALTDSVLVLLEGTTWPPAKPVVVRLEILTDDDERTEEVQIDTADCAEEVTANSGALTMKIQAGVPSGAALLERFSELFPRLDLGSRAVEQLAELAGSEPFFPQVVRHLRALDLAASVWKPGTSFEPKGVTYSVESESTLKDGKLGPMRDFPTPAGFSQARWSLHTKLTGGPGARLYYKAPEVQEPDGDVKAAPSVRVPVGYVGPHLATTKFK